MKYSHTCARSLALRLMVIPVTCALPVLLAGCGSGSSGQNTATTAVALTAQNAPQAAGGVYYTVEGSASVGSSATSGLVGVVVTGGQKKSLSLTNLLVHQVMQIYTLDPSPSAGVAIGQIIQIVPSTSCDVPPGGGTAGTYKMSWNDADNSNSITAADTFDLTFSNCYASSDGATMNGKMTLSKLNVSGITPGSTNTNYSLSATASLTAFSIADATGTDTIGGDLELTDKSQDGGVTNQSTLKGSSLSDKSSKLNATLTLENFSLAGTDDSNSQTYSYSGSGHVIDSALSGYVDFQISTNNPFTGSDNDTYASQGIITITGANNSSVTLTAIDNTTVTLAIDSNGDGQVDSTSNVAWATILP